MSKPIGPTVTRHTLGKELEQRRTALGMSYSDVAQHLGCSDSKVRRMESGHCGVGRPELLVLFNLYEIPPEQHDDLIELQKLGKSKQWWVREGFGSLPPDYQRYLGYESVATTIRDWQLAVIPGLFQTEEYARAVSTATRPKDPENVVEQRVQARMARQRRLLDDGGPEAWVIIDEGVIRRIQGDREVMRAQMEHLVAVGKQRNINIQVLPFTAGGHPGTLGSFTMLEFDQEFRPPVVYLEGSSGNMYLEKASDLDRYTLAHTHLCATALKPERSLRFLAQVAKDLA